MKAKELAEIILTQLPSGGMVEQNIAIALTYGVHKLMQEYGERLAYDVWTPRQLNAWREAFNNWKSTCSLVVADSRWPRHAPGLLAGELANAIAMWPGSVMLNARQHFLRLYDNNAFLGWKPSPMQEAAIQQLRWEFKGTQLLGAGLAADRMGRVDNGARGAYLKPQGGGFRRR